MTARPTLIILAGLPGVGKSTIAKLLARRIGAVYLRVDSVEQALARSTLRIRPAEDAGYVAAAAVAVDNLRGGLDVIADSVNPIELSRRLWLDAAAEAEAEALEVEVVCSDSAEHRRRVETRTSDIPGLVPPSWGRVAGRLYEPWPRPRLAVDTARLSPEAACDAIWRRLSAASPS